MITIKLSAEDERILQRAKTEPELQGARQLVLDRIAQSKLMKEFGRTPKAAEPNFRWKEALAVAKEVLGDNVTFPQLTDYRYYQRINGTIMRDGLDAEYVRGLAEYVRDHLRQPTKFDFMICQHKRICEGDFDQAAAELKKVEAQKSTFGPELPDE